MRGKCCTCLMVFVGTLYVQWSATLFTMMSTDRIGACETSFRIDVLMYHIDSYRKSEGYITPTTYGVESSSGNKYCIRRPNAAPVHCVISREHTRSELLRLYPACEPIADCVPHCPAAGVKQCFLSSIRRNVWHDSFGQGLPMGVLPQTRRISEPLMTEGDA